MLLSLDHDCILVVKMEDEKMQYRHILLLYFRKEKNANEAHKKLCLVFGDKALSKRQCQN